MRLDEAGEKFFHVPFVFYLFLSLYVYLNTMHTLFCIRQKVPIAIASLGIISKKIRESVCDVGVFFRSPFLCAMNAFCFENVIHR